ncbi:MAG: hypothetical protein A2942_01720 [Candidatus Lloydbacteria bacterium RIFCSPLOWO2_01_FULL_50_20]|uniref:Uncharacterized protein n=1 Tax=Candidatus Lloydbacteria bacterium RIFCSPLOWO2_01_FULL_50_20 TaxID=1798665 RepID=A0A1G2DEC9_9BACT|nr:MAG: hypothetical protein A2942_01720 [Candidatus Lloydbacteria bacterium RIFCSPLOWO2_01_FULL_50_20]
MIARDFVIQKSPIFKPPGSNKAKSIEVDKFCFFSCFFPLIYGFNQGYLLYGLGKVKISPFFFFLR